MRGGPGKARGFDPAAWRPPAPRVEACGAVGSDAKRISDRVGVMLQGRLVAVGPERYSPGEIYKRYFREGQPAAA